MINWRELWSDGREKRKAVNTLSCSSSSSPHVSIFNRMLSSVSLGDLPKERIVELLSYLARFKTCVKEVSAAMKASV